MTKSFRIISDRGAEKWVQLLFVQGIVQSYQSSLDQESPKKGQCTTIILHLISEASGGRQSRPGRSSIIIVHGGRPWTISRCPWTTKPSYARRTNTQHLEKFQVFVVVILIAVEEVNSEPVGFHKSWGSYLDK